MTDQRKEFVMKALASGANLSALCREYAVTRKTGRTWRDRARNDGLHGLRERSRRPLHSPGRLQEDEVCHLVMLKLAWPTWGPKKLCQLYEEGRGVALARSTCHRVLKASGLIKERKVRVRRPATLLVGPVVPLAANDVWTIDFKGWWHLGDGRRCEPLTVRDAFSRFVLAAHLPANGRTETVALQFDRLFRQHGLPKVIKSDNGAPFASSNGPLGLSKLSARWVALGIQLEHSRPAHPQDNGAHERMHRDIEAEVAAHVQVDAVTQQAALDVWRHDYNHVRPHERLQGRRPAQLYQKSPRLFPAEPAALDYGTGYSPRLVSSGGTIKYRGKMIFVSTALAHSHVGLRVLSSSAVEVWFNYLLVGTINLQTNRFHSAPSRSVKAVRLAA
ncbi:MAG: Integrase catalytic region [Verrucomicrobia bacterium]|nr:Integrase catalytic region [Verrucomicrobiota bacterium]